MQYICDFPGFEICVSTIEDGDFRDPDIHSEIIRSALQSHGREIYTLTTDTERSFAEYDGVYTNLVGLSIGAMGADCPIVILMGKGECSAIHSGWRGAQKHIILNALKSFHTPKDQIYAFIGPHIHENSYEVGEDFLTYFPEKYYSSQNGRTTFDIVRYIMDDMYSYGLLESHVIKSPVNTFSHLSYHSYRRDRNTGRGLVGVKILPP